MNAGAIPMTTLRASSSSPSPSTVPVKEEEAVDPTDGPVRTTYPLHDDHDEQDEGRGLMGQ